MSTEGQRIAEVVREHAEAFHSQAGQDYSPGAPTGAHRRFDRARLAKLLADGLAASGQSSERERLLDALVYVVRRSQPDAT
jgi:hypothetical protein